MTIACGIEVPHDLMSPAYRKGDIALCALCKKIEAGHDYIIATGLCDGSTPQTTMRIARVERITAGEIFAREYNPPKMRRFSRSKWRGVYRITGKYNVGKFNASPPASIDLRT